MKSGVLKFNSPKERARVALAIRNERDRRGLDASKLRVMLKGSFSIEVEGDDEVFDLFFAQVT